MQIEIKITADDKALEFSRNLGGIAEYFKEALLTNAMEEHGISVRNIAEPENLKVEKKVSVPVAETVEPDTTHFEGPAVSVEELRDKAKRFAKANGSESLKLILQKLKVAKLSELVTPEQRVLASQMIDEANGNA